MPDGRRRSRIAGHAELAVFVAAALLLATSPASSQTLPIGGVEQEYLRVLQLLGGAEPGSLTILPVSEIALGTLDAPHPWSARVGTSPSGRAEPIVARLTDPRLRAFANTSLPAGQNDGAVWEGKGMTLALDAGGHVSWRGLSASFRPTLLYTQNASFELIPVTSPNVPEYGYPLRKIDLPQRFGPESFWTFDPGQSEIRIRGFGATAAFGTTNLWWGPSRRNAIVMSNNAPGFAHVSVGTDGPVSIGIGGLQVQWIWGDLDQSDWFDPALEAKDRFLTGLVATYGPSFLDGLHLGITRVFYAWKPDGGVPVRDYFLVFQGVRKASFATPENPEGNDEHDQMLSIFGRWVIPGAGFEVYFEWARNDHSADWRDFILQPAHSRGYTLGLQRALRLEGDRVLALHAELTDLQKTHHLRASPVYYQHHIVAQGYTHRGQILGAAVGPGGNGQHVGADLYTDRGRAGLFVSRQVRDNDAYLLYAPTHPGTYYDHDVLLQLGAEALVFVDDFDVGGGLTVARELNRYFAGRDLWNLNLSLSARWRLPQ